MSVASQTEDNKSRWISLNRNFAMIEFDIDGKILHANQPFLKLMGYQASEIIGRHHSIFVDPEYAQTTAYKEFWASLRAAQSQSGQFCRISKTGKELWVHGSYSPILDQRGKPYLIMKLFQDVTALKTEQLELEGQALASNVSQSMVQFDLNGNILKANKIFLSTLGYRLDEIVGQHHSILVDVSYRNSPEYKQFWEKLAQGQVFTGELNFLGKNNKKVWLKGSYVPILSHKGKPHKVIHYAQDITFLKTIFERASGLTALSDKLRESFASLHQLAKQVSSGSSQTSSQALKAVDVASHIKDNVSSVERTTVDMSSSVKEIANSAGESADTALKAKVLASEANNTIKTLNQSAVEIGKESKSISTIAQQINLLALNATLEAARAGQAGKRFAVVANEVKDLAKQTANAAKEIIRKIDIIQTDTKRSVEAIGTIVHVIERMDGYAKLIAAAIQEISRSIVDVSQNAHEVASGVEHIVGNIGRVADSAKNSESNMALSLETANRVGGFLSELSDLQNNLFNQKANRAN